MDDFVKSINKSTTNTNKNKIQISTDILGNKYISDSKIEPGMYEFLREEFETFGSWCETIPSDTKDGWYSITLLANWNYEHTECNVDIILKKIK
jgi:hypothetical protein